MTNARGRPRRALVHGSILTATRDLLAASGYERLTIEAIAAQAGVSKQTIYRWWPSKAAIVAEAVLAGVIIEAHPTPPDTGDIARDLQLWLDGVVSGYADPKALALTRALAAASAESQTDAAALYDRSVRPFRDSLVRRLKVAQQCGQVRGDVDLDVFAEAVMGTVLYRVLAGNTTAMTAWSGSLTEILLNGVRCGDQGPRGLIASQRRGKIPTRA
jgi:AcrR family transcriptional regulator